MKIVHFTYRPLLVAALLSVLVVPDGASAQLSLQAGGGLGFIVASGDYSGTTVDYYHGSKYGFSNGYSILGKARASVALINLKVEIDYSHFGTDGETEPGQGSVDITHKIFTIKAGPEYSLVSMPLAPLKPYLGMNLQYNSFSGETSFNGVSRVPSGTFTMNTTSRLGLGFEAGLLVSLGPVASLDFAISYNLMNISGKEYTTVDASNPRRSDAYVSLNDAADPAFRTGDNIHVVQNDRSIHMLMFTASYMFGL